MERWFKDSKYHRDDGPGFIIWHCNGKIQYEVWFFDGKPHRIDGPADIEWDTKGNQVYEDWWIDGNRLNGTELEEYKVWLYNHNLYNKFYHMWVDEEKVLWKLTWV